LFRIYDVDEDDYIGFDDLKVVLKLMVGDNLNEEQLTKIISKTLTEGDKDEDGKLSRDEFAEVTATLSMLTFARHLHTMI
jgi:serine/threonine-protein phosphatase 2B regulatory subunit